MITAVFLLSMFVCGLGQDEMTGGWTDYNGKIPGAVIAAVKMTLVRAENIVVLSMEFNNVQTQVFKAYKYIVYVQPIV